MRDGSAVLVEDAWHWFPKPEAAAEVAGVLRPGGWLSCVWSVPVPRPLPEDECRSTLDETERLIARACAAA